MKGVFLYWWIGCLLIGFVLYDMRKRCPDDDLPSVEVASAVLIWPAYLMAGVMYSGPHIEIKCKVSK